MWSVLPRFEGALLMQETIAVSVFREALAQRRVAERSSVAWWLNELLFHRLLPTQQMILGVLRMRISSIIAAFRTSTRSYLAISLMERSQATPSTD
jgi:hypothetical protein